MGNTCGTASLTAKFLVFNFAVTVAAATAAAATTTAVPTDDRIYAWRRYWNWCGPKHEASALKGLDDSECLKALPAYFDRSSWVCPTHSNRQDPAFGPPATSIRHNISNMDMNALSSVVDDDIRVAVVVVKRSVSDASSLSVRYLGNSKARKPYQPWSSSKIFAASAASMALRRQSNGEVGLASSCQNASLGVDDSLRVGDLLTTACSYDSTLGISSNQIGEWFHAVGGHKDADEVLHHWLGAPKTETFGGDYGESIGTTELVNERMLKNTPSSVDPEAKPLLLSLDFPTPNPAIDNYMSALTMAEWMRRIVHAREDQVSRMKHTMKWEDAESILYGASDKGASAYKGFNGESVKLQWGGASMSSDIYLQLAAGINGTSDIEKRANGSWRIFSKLGFGYSEERHQFELALNGYLCMPKVNHEKDNNDNSGLEYTISMWASDPEHQDHGRSLDLRFQKAMENVTQFLLDRYYYAEEV